jgi:hypothetical protein
MWKCTRPPEYDCLYMRISSELREDIQKSRERANTDMRGSLMRRIKKIVEGFLVKLSTLVGML